MWGLGDLEGLMIDELCSQSKDNGVRIDWNF